MRTFGVFGGTLHSPAFVPCRAGEGDAVLTSSWIFCCTTCLDRDVLAVWVLDNWRAYAYVYLSDMGEYSGGDDGRNIENAAGGSCATHSFLDSDSALERSVVAGGISGIIVACPKGLLFESCRMNVFAKKCAWYGFLVSCIAVVGGFAGIVADRVLLPKIAADSLLSRWGIFQKAAENTVIINKTEQVMIREDDSVEAIALSASPSVVNILSVRRGGDTEIAKVGEEAPKNLGTLQGSGVLVTNDGLIATFHTALLENASYTVFLYNGTSYPATLVATDSLTGLSYLSIAASNLPSISFADPDGIRAGKKLILIANTSEEYRNRYSTGLVGNTDKTFNIAGGAVASSERWEGVYAVDAATIAPYLGGPAIDYQGDLVGIVGNAPSNGEFETFLLPGSAVKASLERQVRGTLSSRPHLGVSYISITKAYAIANSISRDRGALLTTPSGRQGLAILSGSPAEKAGLRVGDIVIAVNEQEINLDNPLSVAIGRLSQGDVATLRILRAGMEQDVSVSL